MPEFFHALPGPLRRSVQLDLHWEMLRHSQLFRSQDIAFKRALSCTMRHQYFLPGEYVFRVNRYSAKMIYIASGVLQVLTEDDAETPILSLSSGSILGEGKLLIPSTCRADIRTATHSEVHILDATSLYRLLNLYPKVAAHLHHKRTARTVIAENLNRLKHGQVRRYKNISEHNGISWMKTQWHVIEEASKYGNNHLSIDLIPIDGTRTSRYLELLALSERVELMSNAVCLTMNCPCILEPESNFLNWWEKFNAFVSVVIILLYPYYITFTLTFPNWLLLLDTMFVITKSIDIFIQASTAVKLENRLRIVDIGHLLRLRLQTLSFIIDIIVTLPIELFMMTFGTHSAAEDVPYYSYSAYRINRLLTIYRLYKYILKLEEHSETNIELLKSCRSVFTYAIAAYWLATATYCGSCRLRGCGVDSWIGYYTKHEEETYGKKELFYNPLITTMYYIFNTLTSLGVSKLMPRNNWEILELDGVIILSLIMYVYFCAELGATHIIYYESKNSATEHLKLVTRFLKLHGNSSDISTRVRDHLGTQWEYKKSNRNDNKRLLTNVCQDLYDKIIIHNIMKTLRAVPIFYQGDESFLEILAKKAKVFLLTKDTMIAQAGLKTTAMYVIRNGYCQVVSALPSDVDRDRSEIVGPGSMVLVVEFLHDTNNLADIHTITTCEIISIQRTDFWNTLNMFPEFKAQFENAIDYSYFTGKTIENLSARRGSNKITRYPNWTNLDEKAIISDYMAPFKRIGMFSFIRYLMLRRGINPHGKNFRHWEEFREVVCFLSALFYPKFFTSLIPYPHARLAGYMFDVVGFVDIYLRLHVSYYNVNGIIVTHPLWTTLHYMTTSFITDIIMSTPLELFGLQNTFGSQNTHLTKAWFYLITRPLLLFRIFGRFATVKDDIKHSHTCVAYFRFLLTAGVMLNALSCANMLYNCEFLHDNGVYRNIECTSYSWFSMSQFKQYNDPLSVYLISVYFHSTFMFRCGNGVILVVTTLEMIVIMLVCMTLIPAWWLMIAQITSNKVGGDLSLADYRQEMQAMLRYLRNEDVSSVLILLSIEEVEHRWKCSKGLNWKKLFKTLPSQLHEEVAVELHGPALAKVNLLKDQDFSATRLLACRVENTCYRKDTPIIQRNEVQGNIYIIKSGLVDILAADDTLICSLGPGGIFGSFMRKKPVRHTMQMMASGHTSLFVISAEEFYNVLDHFPVIQERLSRATAMDAEFVDIVSAASNLENMEKKVRSHNKTCHGLICISTKSRWHKHLHWIICVPVSMISVYLVTSQIALQVLTMPVNSLIYTCDFCFFIKIFVGFHTNFADENLNASINNYKQMVKKYFVKWNLFWLDLLCCIPFEVLAYSVDESRVKARLLTVLKLNRLLRLYHIYHFQTEHQRQLYINPVKRSMFLCATTILFVHMGVCLWILIACHESGCKHNIPPNHEERLVTSRFQAMLLAYQYNFDLLTSVGSHDVQPTTIPEVLVTIFLILVYQVMALNLLTTLATFIHFAQYTFTNFEIQVQRLYSFMESKSLSPILLQRIWEYCLQQWLRQQGAWMPSMILSMPNFLQNQIMFDIYGYLLTESEIFHGLHEDFLYQLTARMKRCVYFPKNYIVQAGDVDHTMYFIHSGKVQVFDKAKPSMRGLGSILGVKQGVTTALPHFNDVIALTVTDIMSLHKDAWKDLLAEFPSARIILYDRIAQMTEFY
ncbi:uncharacterized protein LOC107220421 [Neodiprion lecontei]|uniref:Uncharacterized protein LOC107220421 n=1 Tax=Neodiprion lecontei TaxID=441921 RepID=A0A6J0BIA4_NEOLC|nr:uncharacterized protein LOC107220421 [Neodiprion lecontei]